MLDIYYKQKSIREIGELITVMPNTSLDVVHIQITCVINIKVDSNVFLLIIKTM